MNTALTQPQPIAKASLVTKFAEKFGVDPEKMVTTLKATAFKVKDGEATNEQLMALLIVADQYGLNPWTKEIYAFPDKQNGIVPVVGVDGWSRIINSHEQCDGIEFCEAENAPGGIPEWIECVIYRKDRNHPVRVKEYFAECNRASKGIVPWISHPRRMLRHKALIQCARLAFGFVGIYDEDEANRIVDAKVEPENREPTNAESAAKVAAAAAAKKAKRITKTVDAASEPATKPEQPATKQQPADPGDTRKDAMEAMRLAVSKAADVETLDKLRKDANGYHDDGLFNDSDLNDMKDLIHGKVELLMSEKGGDA